MKKKIIFINHYSLIFNQTGLIKLSKNLLVTYLITFLALSSITGLFLFNPFGTKETQAAWFNDNWAYRKEVPITANAAADTDAFFSFTLDTATLITAGQLQSSCQDIRVTDAYGNILPFHVGRTNACNNAATTIDALAPFPPNSSTPTLPAGASTYYVYYGNPSAISDDQGAFSQSEAVSYTVGALGSAAKGPSPVAYWKFDDAQGTTAQDSSTNNNDGSISGASWVTEDQCLSGKCLRFDGSDDYVQVSDANPLDVTTNFTLSAWVRMNSLPTGNDTTDAQIINKGRDSTTTYAYTLQIQNGGGGNNKAIINLYDGSNNPNAASTSNIKVNEWTFIAATYDGSSLKIYVDGKLEGTTATAVDPGVQTSPLVLGKNAMTTNRYLHGSIDEPKVYNQALSAAQILANFNARSNPEGVASALGSNNQNTPGGYNLSNGLINYWKMDESSWTNDCSTATVADSSGNGAAASCPNTTGPTGGAAGKFGKAGSFDGSDDYLVRATTGSMTSTVSFWFNPTSTAGTKGIFQWASSLTAGAPLMLIQLDAGTLKFYVDADYRETSQTVTTGRWYHTVITLDKSNPTSYIWKFYLDGNLLSTYTGSDNNGGTSNVYFGNGFNGYYNGLIDEARIYNRALSGAEVSRIYNWAPGPVGYWKMDEGTGTTAYDFSSNGNDLTLTNSPGFINAKYGKGVNLSGNDAHLTRADDADFDFGDDNSFSYEAWIKHNTASSQEVILSKFNEAGYKMIMESDGDLTCAMDYDSTWSPTDSITSTAATYDDDLWHHIACVKDGASTLSLYIDGVFIGSDSSLTATNTVTNSDPLYLGIDADATSLDFIGQMDEVKIYNYPRIPSQIIEDMNIGHPAPGSPVGTPYGWWKFDEGADNMCTGGTADTCNSGNGGNSLDGSETNMAIPPSASSGWTNSGKFGKALNFDGSNDGVVIPDEPGTVGISRASWSMWIKPNTIGTQDCLWCKVSSYAGTPANSSWGIVTDTSDSSMVRAFIANADADISQNGSTPTGVLTNGTWTHIAVVYNGTLSNTDRIKIYKNGIPLTTSITGTIPTSIRDSASTSSFGRAPNVSGQASDYNGAIDEPKLYLLALTPEQVKLDMNRGQAQQTGALGASSNQQPNAAANEYCPPDTSASSCTGPVSEWKFNEGSGTSAIDTSGNGNTGTLTNSPSYVNGKINKALNFITTGDPYVTVPAASAINDLGPLTFEAWIYPRSVGPAGEGRIFDKGTRTMWFLNGSPARMTFQVDYATTDLTVTSPSNSITLNTWNHVVVTWDGSTTATNVRMYINGKEPSSYSVQTNASGSRNSDSASSLLIGNRSSDFNRDFDGIIDNVRIFNYVRTQAQVAWDYNKGGPVAWWKMDECQGTTINDSSGNSNTGTWSGSGGGNTAVGTCTTSGAWFDGVSGKRNYSLEFDGSDDVVNAGSGASLDDLNTGGMTISAWIYPTTCGEVISSGNRAGFIAAKNTGNSQTSGGWVFLCINAFGPTNALEFAVDGTSDLDRVSSNNSITLNTWQHVVISWDGVMTTASSAKFYVNGKEVTYQTTSNGSTKGSDAALDLYIGNASTGARTFDGKIDDLKIYNYVMTPIQIKSLFNAGAYRTGPVTGAP